MFRQRLRSSTANQARETAAAPEPPKPKLTELPYILDTTKTTFVPGILNYGTLPLLAEPRYATSSATRALALALQATLKTQSETPLHQLGWYIDPQHTSNLYQWIVELHSFDDGVPLKDDMVKAGITSMILELRFPSSYPASPPFIRIIRPRILSFANGGGGHVTNEGSLCLEMLTSTGWNPELTIEGILMQVRVALQHLEPRPARLQAAFGVAFAQQYGGDYDVRGAMQGYERAATMHKWQIPKDFKELGKMQAAKK